MQTISRGQAARQDSCECTEAVSASARRGPVTMGLVWVSMVASFPCVLIGLDWHKQGFGLTQVLWSLLACMAILLAYSIPMCVLAAKTGLSFKHLCHQIFPVMDFLGTLLFCVTPSFSTLAGMEWYHY